MARRRETMTAGRGVCVVVARLAWIFLALQPLLADTTLVVRVVDPLGEPLHGVQVDLRRPDQPAKGVRLTPRTGRDGRCRFEGLEAGVYHLAVRRFRGWRGAARQTIRITGQDDVIERTLRPNAAGLNYRVTGVVAGFAAERFGQPALFFFPVERSAPPTAPGKCLATLIDRDGSFRARLPAAGEYRITIDEFSSGSRGCQGLKPTPNRIMVGDPMDRLFLEPPDGFER